MYREQDQPKKKKCKKAKWLSEKALQIAVKRRGGSGYVVKKDNLVLEEWFGSN